MKRQIILVPLIILAACAAVPPTRPVPPLPPSLAGSSWHVTAIDGRATPSTGDYSIRFDRTHLGARFGCNAIGADYVQHGYVIDTSGVISTQMACADMSYERGGVAVLNQEMQAAWPASGTLRLSNTRGSIELRRAP